MTRSPGSSRCLRSSRTVAASALLLALAASAVACGQAPSGSSAGAGTGWRTLEAGLELGTFAAADPQLGDPGVRVVRVDPQRFELRLLNASALADGEPMSARSWAELHGLSAAINASMYQADLRTSVSLMQSAEHVNNAHLTLHQSVLAFDPLDPSDPSVWLIDRECESFEDWRPRYRGFVQGIRMLSCRGENVWEPQPRRASTAAIGLDGEGRLLFVHVRTPLTTHDAIELLRELPLGLERLMYAEGGVETQLWVRDPVGEHEFVGSLGAGLDPEADNRRAWPVPNVLGVVRRAG